jgi:DNA segregation ATPase FtsK/SpoIIIE-like protein
LIICDFKDEFNDLKLLPNLYYPLTRKIESFDDLLDELSNELEKRLNILSEYECDNYINLNKILEQKRLKEMLPVYFLINSIGFINDKGSSQKLIYFLKFGYKAGIHLVMVCRENNISSNLVSNTKTKIALKTSVLEKSYSILGNKNACNLNGNGDGLLVMDLDIYHLQLPYISDSDYKRVINKIILH